MAITLRICQDALIAPISNLKQWFLKVDLPDGAQYIVAANPRAIEDAKAYVEAHFGLDIMPLALDEIRRNANDDNPRKASLPAELLEMAK